MQKIIKIAACVIGLISLPVMASDLIPIGSDNNTLYYKIGGGSDFALPPVSDTNSVRLDTNTNLGLGYSCSSYNPALSISNSINNLADTADNLEKSIIYNVTGSLIQLPMYELAQADPTAYNLINNGLAAAHRELDVSTKNCRVVKDQISRGENPYQDWGTIAVGDQWKKQLSLTSAGNADINHAKKEIDAHSGEEGVNWTNGNKDSDGTIHAGGKGQPPVHVIADTVKAGYNAMLNRDLQSSDNAPQAGTSAELARYFPTPQSAMNWITNVVGDQTITTCNDAACKKQQGSMIGHGLLPWITSCNQDKDNCADTIRDHLGNLVTGHEPVTKDNLTKVSADGIALSPDAIAAIHAMDTNQQSIIVNKLAQEIAIQRVIDKALIARNILATGAQVPVISANHPAQVVISHSITDLDNDIRSLAFENQVRKQMMSDTLSEVLNYSKQQQQNALHSSAVSSTQPIIENGAVATDKDKK
ncbi:MAG: integrating conjugative element protein [Gammaproteobacteria bacterium]